MDFFYSVLDCYILEGSCYQLLKSILKVQVHCVSFIGIYNIVSVIHHNTQQSSVMDRVKIIIQRHKNNYFKNWGGGGGGGGGGGIWTSRDTWY